MQLMTRLRADSAGRQVQSGRRVDGAKRLVAVVVIHVIIGACGSTGPDTAPSTTSMPVAPTSTPSISTTTASPPALDQAFLQEQVDKLSMPDEGALMITVIDSPGDAITAATGTDERENSPTADDPFRVGSITKMFTASLVMTLVDDGLVDVDEPALSYVSRVAVPEDVTVRDLLQHTSGIRNYTDSPDFFARMTDDPSQVWTPESAIALVDLGTELFPPGTQFSYSNTNYTILGILIEEVTGKTYPEALRERILDPLGLNDTYLAGFEEGPDPFTGYSGVFGTTGPDDFDYTAIATDAFSAGALISSARDLAIFLTALFDAQVVSAGSLAAMTENEEYGFGIERWDSPAGLYGHGGGIPGYGTLVTYAPATGTTAFWVTTSELIDFGPTVEPIAQLIAGD